jgi:Tol biopolymer transport system component
MWRVSFAGGPPVQLTSGEHQDSYVRWSPDGRRIAFLSRALAASAPMRLTIVPSDGGPMRTLTDNRTFVSAFEWRPGGMEIAYLAGSPGASRLAIVDAGTGRTRNVAILRNGTVTALSWSPNGAELVLVVRQPGRPVRVAIQTLSGSSRDLATAEGIPRFLSWSNDGAFVAWIVETSPADMNARIDISALNGMVTSVRGLNGVPLFAAWSVDARLSMAVRTGNETRIELLDVATGDRRLILPPGIITITDTPSWSRDGTRYAIAGAGRDHPPEVFTGSLPLALPANPDFVGAPPPSVRRITFMTRR